MKNKRLFTSTSKKKLVGFVRGVPAKFSVCVAFLTVCRVFYCVQYACTEKRLLHSFRWFFSNELTEKPNKNYFQLCAQVTCIYVSVRERSIAWFRSVPFHRCCFCCCISFQCIFFLSLLLTNYIRRSTLPRFVSELCVCLRMKQQRSKTKRTLNRNNMHIAR